MRGQVILESLETLDVKRFISEKGCPLKDIIKHDYSWMEWTSSKYFKENDQEFFENSRKFDTGELLKS